MTTTAIVVAVVAFVCIGVNHLLLDQAYTELSDRLDRVERERKERNQNNG